MIENSTKPVAIKVVHFANSDWFFYNFCLPLLRYLQGENYVATLVCPVGPYVETLRGLGWECITVPFNRHGVKPITELRTIARLRIILRRLQPNILHNHTLKCVLYGSIAAAGLKCNIVNTVNGTGYLYRATGLGAVMTRILVHILGRLFFYRKSVNFIFMNSGDSAQFEARGFVLKGKSCIIPSPGVDVNIYTFSEELDTIPLVILPARMLWSKGVGEFVEAAKHLKDRGVIARFALVGDVDAGDSESVPRDKLNTWVSEGLVEWWGHCKDMPSIIASCHVVCLPSYGEGSPMSLIEGSACGRALVASDLPGCKLIVRHGENGLLVPMANANKLADALERLIINSVERKEMGRRGCRIAEKEFSVDQCNRHTMAVYQRTLSI